MPILPHDDTFLPLGALPAIDYTGAEDAPESFPGVFETLGAAYRRSNTIVSGLVDETAGIDRTAKEEGFDGTTLWSEIEGTKYEQHWQQFADIHNRAAFEAMKAQIDAEEDNQRTLAAAGWIGTGAEILAQITDLPTLLPGGAFVRGGRIGYSIGRTALGVGAAGGLAAGVSEFALHASQKTRTLEESLTNIGGATILSGLLGAGAGALLSKAERSAALSAVERAKHPEFEAATDVLHKELNEISLGEPQSVGAAAAVADNLDDLSIAGTAASKQAKATARLNPLLRTLHSPSAVVRGIASRMMDTPVYLKKNLRGEGDTAAETAMQEYARGGVVQALEKQRAAFLDARKNGASLTEKEFREAVGRAMRRNDESDIPGVSAAAKAWRTHVIEPLKQRAIENGLLPADVSVKTADSYFTRMYNRPLIEANESDFKAIVRNWVSGQLDIETRRINARADARLMSLQREINDLESGILRRTEFMKRREQGLEIDPTDFNENEIVGLVRRVQAGEKPPEVETLSQWLKRQKGGIYDPGGELAAVYPDARRIPGLLRKTRRTESNPRGGDGLDDIVLRAWEEGFLNDAGTVRMGMRDTVAERPSIREFLEALDADLRGERVVRHSDIEAARAADDFDRVLRALDRAGVDFSRPLFGTTEDMLGLASRVNRVLDDLDREKIGRLRAAADGQNARKLGDFLSDADRDAYLDEIVDDIYAKVTGKLYDGAVPGNIPVAARGPLKERTFNIPDELIERYLDSDVEMIGRRYARIMAADVELSERFGSPDMKDAFIEIAADYNKLRERIALDDSLDDVARQKALTKLSAREKADIRDLEGVRDLLRGLYRPEIQHTTWARIGRAANTFNFIRAMGGVLVTSLSDAVRPAMVHGLKAYLQDGLVPLIRNLSAVKMSMQEAKFAGAISERWLASRLATMAEITDPYSHSSPFERLLDNMGAGFSKMTGLLHWNDFQKGLTSVVTQNRILKNAEVAATKGFSALPKAEQAYMGFLGIGQGKAEDIGRLFAAHGETLDGVRVANTDAWGDDPVGSALRRAYRAAVNKDVDSVIVTKGVGDVPLMANTPLGRALLQFKSFAIAGNQRVLIRGLQESKARFVGGMIGMTAIGMFIYMLKQLESGRPISTNPGTWIAEGLDRSGIFAVGFEINNALEKAGAPGAYTAASALGALINPDADRSQPASRYAVRSTVGGFLGPSFGAATDAVGLTALGFTNMRSAASGEGATISRGDIQVMRRLTPFVSLPYWRWAIDGFLVPKLKETADN